MPNLTDALTEVRNRGMPIPDKVVAAAIQRLSERGAKLMLYNLLTYFAGKERRNYGYWTRILHILEFLELDRLDHASEVDNPYPRVSGMWKETTDATKTE